MASELELDDLQAVHLVLSGDGTAFRAIVERYGDRVLRFCRSRLGSEEEAADAAQDVFLRAYRSLASYRLGSSFPSWLFSIAANRIRTRGRRLSVERDRIVRAAAEASAAQADDPELFAQRELEAEELRVAVAALPRDLRDCVQCYYFAELSVADCAVALGIGEEAVKSRLFRARGKLRKALERRQPRRGKAGIL